MRLRQSRTSLALTASLLPLVLAPGCAGAGASPPPPAPLASGPTPAVSATAPSAPLPPIITRDVLFGNPDKETPRISPDGKQLAYLAPVNDVMNVFVGPVDDPDKARAVTSD